MFFTVSVLICDTSRALRSRSKEESRDDLVSDAVLCGDAALLLSGLCNLPPPGLRVNASTTVCCSVVEDDTLDVDEDKRGDFEIDGRGK